MAGLESQIAEHGLRVLVAAFNRRAGEADERRLRQRVAHVLGKTVNKIVLAAAKCRAASSRHRVDFLKESNFIAYLQRRFMRFPKSVVEFLKRRGRDVLQV